MSAEITSVIPTIDLKRTYNCPASKVYEAFASSEAIKSWFGPTSCSVISVDWEPVVGQEFRIEVDSNEMGKMAAIGVFQIVEPNQKLAMSWNWAGEPAENESRLTVTFSETGGKTVLNLVHEGFAVQESRDHHEIGWEGTLDKFSDLLENSIFTTNW